MSLTPRVPLTRSRRVRDGGPGLAHKAKMKRLVNVPPSAREFKSATCPICNLIPTHHKCYAEVSDGGVVWDGKRICGKAFCAPCGSKWGCEGSPWRCSDHV